MNFGSGSVDTDVENSAWNETPETNYFKMMMADNQMGRVRDRDNMDDSVIGGETLASVINSNNGNCNGNGIGESRHERITDTQQNRSDRIGYAANNKDVNKFESTDYSTSNEIGPLPNETMSIIGVEDDISTIANDTVNEATKAFFSNHSGRTDSKPRIRLFKEYKTPEKKKPNIAKGKCNSDSKSRINIKRYDDDDDDARTEPETPPGMIQVPAKGSSSRTSYTGTTKDEEAIKPISVKEVSSPIRSKRVYVIAGVLALVLFASIIALSVALKGMRGDVDQELEMSTSTAHVDEGGTGSGHNNAGVSDTINDVDSSNYNGENDILDMWPDLDPTVYTDDFDVEVENIDDTVGDDYTKKYPTEPSPSAISQPSVVPMHVAPSSVPSKNLDAVNAFAEILEILSRRDIVSSQEATVITTSVNSPQYRATVWISEDPNIYNYTEDRIIQRWSLAIFAFNWDAFSATEQTKKNNRSRRLENPPERWLTYTDECTWYSSSSENLSTCDKNGMYRRLDIQDMKLGGSLAPELFLLSDSLRHITLDGNMLEGDIPTQFNILSNLESLRLRRNKLIGSINIDFGRTSNLEIFDAGKNKLTGSIPNNILELRSLTELHLDNNLLTSVIPWDIGQLGSLVELALNDNYLSGWVPNSLANLEALEVLTLGNNNLIGIMPKDVCRLDDIKIISVDCDAQGCECCTDCATTHSPSAFPTKEPTNKSSAAPSPNPTDVAPTIFPSSKPSRLYMIPSILSSSTLPLTSTPTECTSSISVQNDCYEEYVDIEISLKNCDPDSDDWIGIYLVDPVTFDSDRLRNPNIWSWACGTRNCREAVYENSIFMGDMHAGNGEWPLETGMYVAVLARNSAQPYTAFAVSEAFIIEEVCPKN